MGVGDSKVTDSESRCMGVVTGHPVKEVLWQCILYRWHYSDGQ